MTGTYREGMATRGSAISFSKVADEQGMRSSLEGIPQ
jgi:hypothetical protein